MNMTYRLLVTAAICRLVASPFPANAQIAGGSFKTPSAAELAQRTAAAQAEFGTVLSQALSPTNIQALFAVAKDDPEVLQSDGITNFDNVTAPCVFRSTTALRGVEQLAAFWAPGRNGGGIVNECSNFGVEAHSPPNFLAFNNTATYEFGGVPELRQIILFGTAKDDRLSLGFRRL